jgi:hypothetical protein
VVSNQPDGENLFPEVLRGWFGTQAGQPGTQQSVVFERAGSVWIMRPEKVQAEAQGPELWRPYMREEIPALFGAAFQSATWRQGVISLPGRIILLVTLEKGRMQESHQYEDKFLSDREFQWQSQNRTTQQSRAGQALARHVELGIEVHLFVRRSGLVDGRAAPFTYCGQVDFQRWERERPITVWWRLSTPLPERLRKPLKIS